MKCLLFIIVQISTNKVDVRVHLDQGCQTALAWHHEVVRLNLLCKPLSNFTMLWNPKWRVSDYAYKNRKMKQNWFSSKNNQHLYIKKIYIFHVCLLNYMIFSNIFSLSGGLLPQFKLPSSKSTTRTVEFVRKSVRIYTLFQSCGFNFCISNTSGMVPSLNGAF